MSRGSVAASVRKSKDAHPERYCPVKNCLWRLKEGQVLCPKHAQAEAEEIRAERDIEIRDEYETGADRCPPRE